MKKVIDVVRTDKKSWKKLLNKIIHIINWYIKIEEKNDLLDNSPRTLMTYTIVINSLSKWSIAL